MNIGIKLNIQALRNYSGGSEYILDVIPDSVGGYSLHRLSSSTTSSVRVRRSSDNEEQDFSPEQVFGGGLESWVGVGNDGFVATWYDQSGGGNDAIQATASNQPKAVSNGSLIDILGYKVIQYDGSGSNLSTAITATGTMLMGGREGSAFFGVNISGAYNLLGNAFLTKYPINETIRVIWNRDLTTEEKTAIETSFTNTKWGFTGHTSFYRYFRNRPEITEFPAIDTSSGLDFYQAFRMENITSFPSINVSNGQGFNGAWGGCSSLTSFPALDFSSANDFQSTWSGCSSLTSFPLIDVTGGSSFNNTWQSCSSLTSFPALDFSNANSFFGTWNFCTSLEDFPVNMFDSVTATNFTFAFSNTNLTQTSIDNILTSIDTAGQSNGTFDQSGGSAPSATGEAAIDNLRARGWTVTVTGGY